MIDTLETSIKLETSGFTNDQAKALTEVDSKQRKH